MLKAYTYSLGEDAIKVLQEAFSESYGEDLVTLEELEPHLIRSKVRLSDKDSSVVGVFIKDTENLDVKSSKLFMVGDLNGLITHLNSLLDLSIPMRVETAVEASQEDDTGGEDEGYQVNKLMEEIALKDGIIENYKSIIKELQNQLEESSSDMNTNTKSGEFEKLKADYDNLKDILLRKEEAFEELNERLQEAQERISNQGVLISSLEESKSELIKVSNENTELNDKIHSLEKSLNQSQDTILILNEDKISLNDELEKLKDVEKNSSNTLDLMTRVGKAERDLKELLNSPFGEIYQASESNGVFFLKNSIPRIKNVKFVFTANQGYEKEFYRLILGAITIDKNNPYLFVDAVNSSFADYVFEVVSVNRALDWFSNGGSPMQFLSKCGAPNLKVLIPTLSYLNDGYFLTVDWIERLKDLESLNTNVIVYGGSLSNVVGKYLFSLFNSSGNDVKIFIQGSLVFTRNGLSQVSGLQGKELSDICIFNLNKSALPVLGAFKGIINFRIVEKSSDLVLRG